MIRRLLKRLLSRYYTIERIDLKPGNEMWRIGRGYNDYRPFFRIDWGNVGYRFIPRN